MKIGEKKVRGRVSKEHTVKNNKNKKKQLQTLILNVWSKDKLAHRYLKLIYIIIYEDKT